MLDSPVKTMKTMLKRPLRALGFNVSRWPARLDPSYRRSIFLAHYGVDLVVDVGANTGQYASTLREWGYRAAILSLEPMAEEFALLAERARRDGQWTAIKFAAGSQAGSETINVAANSVSSSMRPMLERHRGAAPTSFTVREETIEVRRLDDLVLSDVRAAAHPFLKIDTQGYEDRVLDGAPLILAEVVGIELEMSIVELYEGQCLWEELHARLQRAGFELSGVSSGFWDRRTGDGLQFDATYRSQAVR